MKRWNWNVVIAAVALSFGVRAWAQDTRAEPAKKDADPKVTLREPGAEPRKPLRYAHTKDSRHALTMSVQMTMNQTVMGMQVPETRVPTMEMVMDVHVVDVHSNGDAKFEFVLSRAHVLDEPGGNPMIVNMVKKTLSSMVGLKGSAIVTNRGFSRDVNIDVPANADATVKQQIDGLRQSINQFATPLPQEPVGKGAKWDVDAEVSTGGIMAQQRTSITLENVQDNVLELTVAVTKTADEQEVKNPDFPPNMKVRLTSLTSKGSGKTTLRLSQSVPVEVELTDESEQTLLLTGQNNMEQEMTQRISTTMKLKSGPPEVKPQEDKQEAKPQEAKPDKGTAPAAP